MDAEVKTGYQVLIPPPGTPRADSRGRRPKVRDQAGRGKGEHYKGTPRRPPNAQCGDLTESTPLTSMEGCVTGYPPGVTSISLTGAPGTRRQRQRSEARVLRRGLRAEASAGKSRQRGSGRQGRRTAVGSVKMQPPGESPAHAALAAMAAVDGRSPSAREQGRQQLQVPPRPWLWDLPVLLRSGLTLRRKRGAAGRNSWFLGSVTYCYIEFRRQADEDYLHFFRISKMTRFFYRGRL
ncbi:uncharacterized protein LOC129564103 [Moschus berezovskii]|uniref:uncharacterized protein LOC129564103 n=1 Tax=Moschus berezovskii TaxID=68408 RepID=UPI0024446CC6|nr:uncharacterized protein LOC129564103 [Moschus berezovskii]